jgi:hypothetical protein
MHYSLFRTTVALMAPALTPPLYSLQIGPASATSRAQTERPKTIVAQSISGDVYRNGADTLPLTVPEGWRTNDNIVEPKLGIGGLSSPDNEAQLEIQQMPTEDSPTTLARKLGAKGDSAFRGYRKLRSLIRTAIF